jgi:NADH-quinone oxidoreductase subunit L
MVAAGVYLLCRLNFIFAPVLPLLMVLGVLTALCAAIWAFGQSDIKKVLAYSTVSQLGFMVAAVGLGAPIVAFFHLTTHAFFKALLFLGAGAVIDACHHKQQITEMGGLWKKLPLTTALFLVGTLALAGFPFTAGFFSKDAILTVAREHNVIVFGFLMLSSLFTALYMGRLFGLVFLGAPRSEAAEHPHGGGTSYAAPLILLSLGAIAGGAIHFYPSFAAKLFRHLPHEGFDLPLFVWSIFVAVLGALVAFLCARAGADVIPTWSRIFSDTWKFFDQVWNSLGKIIGERFAGLSKFFDEEVIGQTVIKGGGQTIGGLGQLTSFTYKSLLTYIIYFLLLGVLLFLLFVHA